MIIKMNYYKQKGLKYQKSPQGKYQVIGRARLDGKARNEGNSWFTKNGYEQSYVYNHKTGKKLAVKVRKGRKIVKYIPIKNFRKPKICYKTNPNPKKKTKKEQKLSEFF